MARQPSSETVQMKLAVGVHLEGTFHFAREGDRNTPSIASYVDPDSLELIGRPDRVALWMQDIGAAAPDSLNCQQERTEFLDDLASQLRDHHEESDPHDC